MDLIFHSTSNCVEIKQTQWFYV